MSNDASPLPIPIQGWLAAQRSKLQWLRYKTGQPLLQADRLPHQVMFIAEGAVRLIADDPATGPFTLARLGSGDAIGWSGPAKRQLPWSPPSWRHYQLGSS
jgi:CRP-like cAMP-binding protein